MIGASWTAVTFEKMSYLASDLTIINIVLEIFGIVYLIVYFLTPMFLSSVLIDSYGKYLDNRKKSKQPLSPNNNPQAADRKAG